MSGDPVDTDEADTPEQSRARKVAAFAAHGPRYARLAELLLGTNDPMFALAHLVVDHEARLDGCAERIRHLEFQLDQMTKGAS